MKPTFHCIFCHVNHIYSLVSRLAIDEKTKLHVMRELTHITAKHYSTPPDCAYELYTTFSRLTGINDPLSDVKKQSNALMLTLLPQLRALCSDDKPILQALRIAMAANIIDYGIGGMDYKTNFLQAFKQMVNDIIVPDDFYNEFFKTASSAQNILYIADNAGEIVADMLLMEYLPKGKITCAVRGGPVINDATIDDAQSVGIDKITRVITTGDRTPGINVHRCGKDFLYELSQADMVILKGQGNFETMIDASLEGLVKKGIKLFFIFKVKCLPVAQFIDKQLGDSSFVIRKI